jgi:hypothetical protein
MLTPASTASAALSRKYLRLIYVLSVCALVAVAGHAVRVPSDETGLPFRGGTTVASLERGRATSAVHRYGHVKAGQGHSSNNEIWALRNEGRQGLLSVEDGPWNSDAWSNSIALCATMRQENATDVREWLQYYRYSCVR